MSYKHLTKENRYLIEKLYNLKWSIRKIATVIGVHYSTISREIKCGKDSRGEFSVDTSIAERPLAVEATRSVLAQLPQEAVKSVTSDRGKECSCYKDIEAMGIPFYFAEPYSSWQRGSNENCNGLLREFFPKKTDLAKVTKEELLKALLLINGRLRKCLGFKTTAAKAFLHELQILT